MRAIIEVNESQLAWPLRPLWAGILAAQTVEVVGVPGGMAELGMLVEAAGSDTPFAAAGTDMGGGRWRVYLMPYCFPKASDLGLKYQIVGTDANGERTWLGTGALGVKDCGAAGSSLIPSVIPADTYVRNPKTGLYHKVTAEVDEDGNITLGVETEGVAK